MFEPLPLPTGRFIVAVLSDGAIFPWTGEALNGVRGQMNYRSSLLHATLFPTERDAENCARVLNGREIASPRLNQLRRA